MSTIKNYLLLAAVLFVAACESPDKTADELVVEADKTFIINASDIGLFYVNAGQTAATNSAMPSLAAFGNIVSSGQANSNKALKILAEERGISSPTTLSAARQQTLDSLSARKGEAFDTLFPARFAGQLTSDIVDFEKVIPTVISSDIKSWADIQLTMMREHLQRAIALPDSIN